MQTFAWVFLNTVTRHNQARPRSLAALQASHLLNLNG